MEARIVTLEPSEEPIVVSYEEAFGEYSEARGSERRAKRLKRRQERQALRMQRIRNRQERRRARREGRRERMRERQERRTERMRLRQGRRTERRKMRLERKALGQEEEGLDEEEEPTDEAELPTDTGAGAPPSDTGAGTGGGAPEDVDTDQTYGGGYTGGGGGYTGGGGGSFVPPTSEDVTDYGSEDAGYTYDEEQPQYDEADYSGGGYEEDPIDQETGESDYESGFTGDMGFDGVIELSEDDARWNEYFSSAEGTKRINPKVSILARQIEQHKELINRLQKSLKIAESKGNRKAARNIALMIQRKQQRLNQLESQLASYSKTQGEYTQVAGGRSAVARKKAEVRRAKSLARAERKMVNRASKKGSAPRVGVTEVEQGLNPEISDNRIEIPARGFGQSIINTTRSNVKGKQSGFDGYSGTGLIGLDQTDDYDAPNTRKFDVEFSEFGGGKGGVDVKSIAIGVGVGVIAILLAKKFLK